ncbi:MAG: hypothetical protein ACK5D5_00280 [Bacteroidota bacterium]
MRNLNKIIILLLLFIISSAAFSQVEVTSTGTSTAYTLNVPGVFPLRSGIEINFRAHVSCGANPTRDVSGSGPSAIMKNGNSTNLIAGDIAANQVVKVVYDGSKWQMVSPTANTSNGTVTSVGISAPTGLFTVSGSPITSSGNLTLGFQTLSSNVFFASPNGLGGQPSFRSIVSGDLPLIPLSKGGTNASLTAVNGGIVYSDASAFGITSAGTSGQVLQSNGAAAPSWVTPSFLPSGTNGQTLRHNGSGWVANSFLFNDGSNIGIGTISPTYPLHIESSSDAILNINSKSASQNTIAGLRLSMFDSYVGTQYFLYSEKNDNTTNSGSSDFVMRKDFSTAGGYLKFFKFDNSTNNLIVNDSKTYTGNFGNFVVANGNVGIGVALPSKKLHVENPISNGDSLGNISVFHNSSGIGTAFSAVSNNSGTNAPGTTWSSLRIAGYNNISPIGPIDFAIMAKGYYSSVYAGIFLNQSAPNNYVALGGGSTFTMKIVDGYQGANKVLKSDATGVASWADLSSLPGGLSGGTINYVPKWTSATSLSSTSLIFDNGTNVGIGTNTPSAKLHVAGSSIISNNTVIDPDNYVNQTIAGSVADGSGWQLSSSIGGNSGTGHSWAIGHNGTSLFFGMQNGVAANTMQTYMYFDANRNTLLNPTSGLVGIGTNSPTEKLSIANGSIGLSLGKSLGVSPSSDFFSYDSKSVGHYSLSWVNDTWNAFGPTAYLSSYSGIKFFSNGLPQMSINSTGNIGMGTSNPSASSRLTVVGDIEIPAANDYKYSSAKTKYLNVPAAAFNMYSTGASSGVRGSFTGGGSCWISGGTYGTTSYFSAPITLPEGAQITNLDVYVWDNDATYNLQGTLYQIASGSTITFVIATTNATSGASAALQTISGTGSDVVGANDAYYIRVSTVEEVNTTNLRIYGARVTYTVTKAD